MGTFSSARLEYDDPEVPALWRAGRNLRKAFLRGFASGIWHDWREPSYPYSRPNMQAAFGAGFRAAHAARRARGEVFGERL